MDRSRVEQIIRRLLIELGEDPSQERLVGTPRRVAELLEMFAVQEPEPIPIQSASDSAGRGRMIIVPNFSFVSLCEHHLLPFFGQIHIAPRQKLFRWPSAARKVPLFRLGLAARRQSASPPIRAPTFNLAELEIFLMEKSQRC